MQHEVVNSPKLQEILSTISILFAKHYKKFLANVQFLNSSVQATLPRTFVVADCVQVGLKNRRVLGMCVQLRRSNKKLYQSHRDGRKEAFRLFSYYIHSTITKPMRIDVFRNIIRKPEIMKENCFSW